MNYVTGLRNIDWDTTRNGSEIKTMGRNKIQTQSTLQSGSYLIQCINDKFSFLLKWDTLSFLTTDSWYMAIKNILSLSLFMILLVFVSL